jgi:hypothetical protein
MTKRIAVKIAGSEREPLDLTIKPGTTAADILTQLNLQGYLLTTGPNSSHFYGDDELVYPNVTDGDKLWATTPADVGSGSLGEGRTLPLLHESLNKLHNHSLLNTLKLKHRLLWQRLHALRRGTIIRRSPKTYLSQQGWRKAFLHSGSEWQGYYRTRFGSFKGRVVASNPPHFYLYKPPEALKLKHPHRACFSSQGNGWFSVHFRTVPRDIDSGAIAIERILTECMRLNK